MDRTTKGRGLVKSEIWFFLSAGVFVTVITAVAATTPTSPPTLEQPHAELTPAQPFAPLMLVTATSERPGDAPSACWGSVTLEDPTRTRILAAYIQSREVFDDARAALAAGLFVRVLVEDGGACSPLAVGVEDGWTKSEGAAEGGIE